MTHVSYHLPRSQAFPESIVLRALKWKQMKQALILFPLGILWLVDGISFDFTKQKLKVTGWEQSKRSAGNNRPKRPLQCRVQGDKDAPCTPLVFGFLHFELVLWWKAEDPSGCSKILQLQKSCADRAARIGRVKMAQMYCLAYWSIPLCQQQAQAHPYLNHPIRVSV